MVGLVFGIILLLVGIGAGIGLYLKTDFEYAEDANGRYKYDEHGNRVKIVSHPLRKFTAITVIAGVLLCTLLTGLGCIASVDTGHVGIVRTFGKVENYTFDSGMHFKAPWNSVIQMDNRVQKTTIELPCFSSDIQEVNTVYTVNYQISKTNAQNLYRDVGTGYLETVVNPTIQETVKTVIARYTAEDLIAKRAEVAVEIENLLTTNLQKYNIDVASTAIENMDFTDSFTAAVEAKAVAAQNKLQAQIEQDRLTMEAQKAAERAQIEAQAQAVVDQTKAEAAAAIAEIQAEADARVAEISANAAEYQGQKDAAIALQRLASINGWTVKTEKIDDTHTKYTVCYADGTPVTEADLKIGAQRLIEYYYTQTWDGKLPDTFVGDGDISSIIVGTK
jgi:regulator of protease activity HflC (stomatin/prohibitin superfamily)